MTETTWLSTKEASAYLGVNLRTLYRFIDEGELAAYKFGRVIRLKESDLVHFVEASRITPGSLEHLYPEPVRRGHLTTEAGDGPTDPSCLFCGIVAGTVPARIIGTNDHAVAFRDIDPKAPTHVLVVPRHHLADVTAITAKDGEALVGLVELANAVAQDEGIAPRGYRLVFNIGDDAGNTVPHLHLHLLGGHALSWPPG